MQLVQLSSESFPYIKFHFVIGRNPQRRTAMYDLRGLLSLASLRKEPLNLGLRISITGIMKRK